MAARWVQTFWPGLAVPHTPPQDELLYREKHRVSSGKICSAQPLLPLPLVTIPVFVVTSALPYFWVGMLLILVFSVWTNGALPNDGGYDNAVATGWNRDFVASVLQQDENTISGR